MLKKIISLILLSASLNLYSLTSAELQQLAVLAAQSPLAQVDVLILDCVFNKTSQRSFASYVDEIIAIINKHPTLFEKQYPDFKLNQVIKDLKNVRSCTSGWKLGWKLRKYAAILPAQFSALSIREQLAHINRRLDIHA